jgi:organic radical activating enzyme
MSEKLIQWRDKNLNSISRTFCAAKWYNASIHLGHGYTGSCHLPLPHPVDIEQIKIKPNALHNTDHKKSMRKMMLEGVAPAECSYCWKIEGIGRNNVSDRIYKSQIYSKSDIAILKNLPWDADVGLKTMEVSFDRQCNFGCSYCNASYSTSWQEDIDKNGPYLNFAPGGGGGAYQSDGSWAEEHGRHLNTNPYVEAFLQWYPELTETLDELRITGGEPTVSQNFWRFVEIMKKNSALNMRFAVNSNLGSDKGIERLIEATHQLLIKEFDLYTSNESFGAHAEYIRDGLKYDAWRANLVKFIENADFRAVTIMMTINNLCLFSITEFLDDMSELKAKYAPHRPNLDFNILRWPGFMSPLTLPDDIKHELHAKLQAWFDKNRNSRLYGEGEKAQIQRLLDYIEVVKKGHVHTTNDKDSLYHDFKSFFTQYDRRRGKNFCATFPRLADWYNNIQFSKEYPTSKHIVKGKIQHFEEGVYKWEENKPLYDK